MSRLQRSFYLRPTLEVCPDILGKYLVYHSPQGKVVGEINEVEAYIGFDDPASHSFSGLTPRTEIMFREGGFSYIYFIYGMYFCFNVTTEIEGFPAAILIRSVIPVEGIEIMYANRHGRKDLTNGPGKLCQAFGFTLGQNKVDLVTSTKLYLENRGMKVPHIQVSPRIGISKATEKPWRFHY